MMFEHTSVMPLEVHDCLALEPGKVCVDCTLGGSGHALKIVESILPDGFFIGIDQDVDAVENAEKLLKPFSENVRIFHDNFAALPVILKHLDIDGLDGIVLDLGLSLHQLTQGKRGFSFQKDEPLDMRMDIRAERTAADIVNTYNEKDLADLFFKYGEERMSRRIARHIVQKRKESPVTTSRELADIVVDAVPAKIARSQKIHPATRVFQGLRIAVNRELEVLEQFMDAVPSFLNKGGRICIISFHSLEDRIVKQYLRRFEKGCVCPKNFPICTCGLKPQLKSVSRKPLMPTQDEIRKNPMARSARLRAAEKV